MSLEVIHGGYAWPGREPVLTGVNFRFDGTGVMSILGPNGAGKTTLLRCMLGLLKFTEGEATLDGRPVSNWKPRDFWRTIGYVPQAKLPGFASMTLADMVVLGRSAHIGPFSLPSDADWEVVDRVMTEVGIEHLAGRLCSEVSGGQFQLALIARALAAEPRILVLDEPESNLDFRNQMVVLNVIERLTEQGLGAVINTHFPAHALEISTKTLLVPRHRPPIFGDTRDVMTEDLLSDVFDACASGSSTSPSAATRASPPSNPDTEERDEKNDAEACGEAPDILSCINGKRTGPRIAERSFSSSGLPCAGRGGFMRIIARRAAGARPCRPRRRRPPAVAAGRQAPPRVRSAGASPSCSG